MYNIASSLVFVPIVNSFISVKMAFGPIVALIWAGIFGLGVLLSLLNINLIAIFASIILTIALLACIVKLITKKYELFYFFPTIHLLKLGLFSAQVIKVMVSLSVFVNFVKSVSFIISFETNL